MCFLVICLVTGWIFVVYVGCFGLCSLFVRWFELVVLACDVCLCIGWMVLRLI